MEHQPAATGQPKAAGQRRGASWPVPVAGTLRRHGDAYSSFVGLMKFLLPAAAFVLVALVLLWPQIERTEKSIRRTLMSALSPEDIENVQIVGPRYRGVDERNQPYLLTADLARQSGTDNDLVSLSAPKADMTLQDGTWLALTAKSGAYHQKGEKLDLLGEVSIFHDSGYTVQTDEARIDLAGGTAEGDQPVVAHGPLGSLESEGFRAFDKGQVIIFTGKARLVIYLDDEGLAGILGGGSAAPPADGRGRRDSTGQ